MGYFTEMDDVSGDGHGDGIITLPTASDFAGGMIYSIFVEWKSSSLIGMQDLLSRCMRLQIIGLYPMVSLIRLSKSMSIKAIQKQEELTCFRSDAEIHPDGLGRLWSVEQASRERYILFNQILVQLLQEVWMLRVKTRTQSYSPFQRTW